MPRILRMAAAQMGTTNKWDTRTSTLTRMINLLQNASTQGAQVVLFPEIAFTTFFPRYLITDEKELESWFEHGDIRTSPNTKAFFDTATELGVDICVGFAEATDDGRHYNSCIYFHASTGSILSKYRKIHLPGDFEPLPDPEAVNQLEKRYFLPGDLGYNAFRVPGLLPDPESETEAAGKDPIFGLMICNDRRWAESWRVYGLQGAEVILCGYNTNANAPAFWGLSSDMSASEAGELSLFHHKLVMQAHSYTNATFSVSAARCGLDDGKFPFISGSMIVDPEGRVVAENRTEGDEVIIADCDLDLCQAGKKRTFDFGRHRRVEHYGRIVQQTGVVEPPLITSTSTPETVDMDEKKEEEEGKKILLLNPNATKSMTDACLEILTPTLPPDITVHGYTAPHPAPTAIESRLDAVLSSAAVLRSLLPLGGEYAAILVACYSDHPLIPALREELSIPVIGIMEASLFAARTVGGRFGVVAVSERSRVLQADAIRGYGFEGFCVGVESCGLGVLELEDGAGEVIGAMCEAARRVVGMGADTVILGCAGMTKLKGAVEKTVGGEVQVVDGVVAGVQHLIGMVRMGVRTAKRGAYSSSKEKRVARGQDYL